MRGCPISAEISTAICRLDVNMGSLSARNSESETPADSTLMVAPNAGATVFREQYALPRCRPVNRVRDRAGRGIARRGEGQESAARRPSPSIAISNFLKGYRVYTGPDGDLAVAPLRKSARIVPLLNTYKKLGIIDLPKEGDRLAQIVIGAADVKLPMHHAPYKKMFILLGGSFTSRPRKSVWRCGRDHCCYSKDMSMPRYAMAEGSERVATCHCRSSGRHDLDRSLRQACVRRDRRRQAPASPPA